MVRHTPRSQAQLESFWRSPGPSRFKNWIPSLRRLQWRLDIHFFETFQRLCTRRSAVVVVAAFGCHMTSGNRQHRLQYVQCRHCRPPSSLVIGQELTMCDIVWISPQSRISLSVIPHTSFDIRQWWTLSHWHCYQGLGLIRWCNTCDIIQSRQTSCPCVSL